MKNIFRHTYIGLGANSVIELLRQRVPAVHVGIILPGGREEAAALYLALSALPATSAFRFFFIIPPVNNLEWVIGQAGRFFFLHHYYYPKRNHPLLVHKRSASAVTRDAWNGWLQSQGMGLSLALMLEETRETVEESDFFNFCTYQKGDEFFDILDHDPSLRPLLFRSNIIYAGNGVEASDLDDRIRGSIKKLYSEQAEACTGLNAIMDIVEKRIADTDKIAFLENELQNARTYNKMLVTADETNNIRNFYHEQYEVLPLWYKRFGHVIKILTGKRKISFMSNRKKS